MNKLSDRDKIITAYARYANGPGWSNAPVWVVIRGQDGTLREECLQPSEQSADILKLYRICAVANAELTDAVVALYNNGSPA